MIKTRREKGHLKYRGPRLTTALIEEAKLKGVIWELKNCKINKIFLNPME